MIEYCTCRSGNLYCYMYMYLVFLELLIYRNIHVYGKGISHKILHENLANFSIYEKFTTSPVAE